MSHSGEVFGGIGIRLEVAQRFEAVRHRLGQIVPCRFVDSSLYSSLAEYYYGKTLKPVPKGPQSWFADI